MAQRDVISSVTGVVFEVVATVGTDVAEGDVIVVVESMKMEIPLTAPCAGKLGAILVAEADTVDENQVVALIEA